MTVTIQFPIETKITYSEWGATGNEYGVLTSYPTGADNIGKSINGHTEMPHLCAANIVRS